MRSLVMLMMLSTLGACSQKSAPAGQSGSAAPASPPSPQEKPASAPAGSATAAGSATPSEAGSAAAPAPGGDGSDEVAQLVVHDVGSKALGSQKIEASCVSVTIMPAGKWTVAAARLKDCGDKTARSILWLYKRADNGKWSEDYVGQPPRCWKGVPADIADAVTLATQIPRC